jgi:hypothetical protein
VTLAKRIGNDALDRLLGARGEPLDAKLGARLGAAYDAELANTRVVDDAESHAAARALDAVAFTAGATIYVGERAPPLSSPSGESLLAHELAHVVQQREAGPNRVDAVSGPDDAHEHAATAASQRAVRGEGTAPVVAGAVPAVQRQPQEMSVTKRAGLSRAQAQQILERYFERTLQAQGGSSVRMSDDVKNTIRRIFLNDVGGLLRIDGFLGRTVFPGSPAELAAAVAAYLPDPIDPSRLAHLEAPSSPGPSKSERVADVVKKTAPYESPETLERQWKFDQDAKDLRRGEGTIGPYGVDVLRLYNIGKELPRALKTPATPKPEGKTYAEVEAAIAKISASELTPAAARGTAKADEFADAQLVARDLARQLDDAQQRRGENVTLRLGANYAGVKDRAEIIKAIVRIVRLIRDALPHHAGAVSSVDVYFGDNLVQRIPLGGSAE